MADMGLLAALPQGILCRFCYPLSTAASLYRCPPIGGPPQSGWPNDALSLSARTARAISTQSPLLHPTTLTAADLRSHRAARFDVSVDFLLQHAAYLYDSRTSQLRAQMRKAAARGSSGSAATSPTPTASFYARDGNNRDSERRDAGRAPSALSVRSTVESPVPPRSADASVLPLGSVTAAAAATTRSQLLRASPTQPMQLSRVQAQTPPASSSQASVQRQVQSPRTPQTQSQHKEQTQTPATRGSSTARPADGRARAGSVLGPSPSASASAATASTASTIKASMAATAATSARPRFGSTPPRSYESARLPPIATAAVAPSTPSQTPSTPRPTSSSDSESSDGSPRPLVQSRIVRRPPNNSSASKLQQRDGGSGAAAVQTTEGDDDDEPAFVPIGQQTAQQRQRPQQQFNRGQQQQQTRPQLQQPPQQQQHMSAAKLSRLSIAEVSPSSVPAQSATSRPAAADLPSSPPAPETPAAKRPALLPSVASAPPAERQGSARLERPQTADSLAASPVLVPSSKRPAAATAAAAAGAGHISPRPRRAAATATADRTQTSTPSPIKTPRALTASLRAYSREGSEGARSMTSSFSDLDGQQPSSSTPPVSLHP